MARIGAPTQSVVLMSGSRAKYSPEPEPQQFSFVTAGLPYSFDLKGASAYTDFSETDIRAAVTSGELAVVSDKPYRMRRVDLEKWVDVKRHFARKKQNRTAA